MRILFLTQVLPFPLDAGPRVRAHYVLRHLLDSGHEVTLASFVRPDDTAEAEDHLRTLGLRLHTVPMRRSHVADLSHWLMSLPTPTPFLIARDRSRAMGRLLRRLVREHAFDAVHADQLWMIPYGLRARRHAGAGTLLVTDRHNAVQRIPRMLAAGEPSRARAGALRLEAAKLRRYEKGLAPRVDRAVWVSESDRRVVEGPNGARGSRVIPICVDPDEWKPLASDRPRRRVTFVGGLHWPPNAAGVGWFLREVWPRVRGAAPDAELSVIGRVPEARAAELRRAAEGRGVEITGRVPDTAPYLRDTAAFVVPLLAGGGMRVKILDAWSRGLPVVSTPLGHEGIDAEPGRDLLVAEDAAGFADAVTTLLGDPALQDRLGRRGRRRIETSYDWRRRYRDWDDVYPPADGVLERAANAREAAR